MSQGLYKHTTIIRIFSADNRCQETHELTFENRPHRIRTSARAALRRTPAVQQGHMTL